MRNEDTEAGVLRHWSVEDVHEGLDRGEVVLIDVRTPAEFAFERIRGALLSPMQELDPKHLPQPGGRRHVVFHCGSGVRSRRMAELALRAGWSTADHMEGGFAAWKQAGLAYIGTDMASGAPKDMTARK